jgi:hypothetical protein
MDFLLQLDAKTTILGISAIVALFAVYRNTVISRRRATVDLVLHQKQDSGLAEANILVNPLIQNNNISDFCTESAKGSEERKAIFKILNNYEFVAVGVREKAFDLSLYKRMSHGTVVRDWDCFKSFVYDLRQKTERPTLFQEFEWLAKMFKKSRLKADSD